MVVTSREIAVLIRKPHASIAKRLANSLKRLPKLLGPVIQQQAFINDDGKAEIEYKLEDVALEYVYVEFGKDGVLLKALLSDDADTQQATECTAYPQ